MQSIAHVIDEQMLRHKHQKHFDVSVMADVFIRALSSESPALLREYQQGHMILLKVVGQQNRVLQLGVNSALALVVSYHLPQLLQHMNDELGDLALSDIRLVHQIPD